MKPYFAKYLPVEGEIKHDDFYISGRDGNHYKKHRALKTDDTDKRAKLFLCSRDIQVGDKARAEYQSTLNVDKEIKCETIDSVPHWETVDGFFWEKDATFKVIGEISPEATWVKEGDEFDETEVDHNLGVVGVHPLRILIKGPCGHFH